jgi:succinoglycan biosynthesis transport protein ExoP
MERKSEGNDPVKQPFSQSNQNSMLSSANPAMQQGPASEVGTEGESFTRFIQFLRKRTWPIVIAVVLGLATAMLLNLFIKKQYTSAAQIEIVPDISGEFRVEQMQSLGGGEIDANKIDTEIQILQSRSLALQVIRELHLESNADFLQLQNGHPWDSSKPAVRDILIAHFLKTVNVERLGHTNIIRIAVTSQNPTMAALIANSLVDNYVDNSFRQNYLATTKVSAWLNSQLDTMKDNLETSQNQMLQYQQQLGVVGIDPQDSIMVSTLQEMNKQAADSEVNTVLKKAQLQAVEHSSPAVIDELAGMDPSLQYTKEQLTELKTEYSSLSQTYGLAYPRVKNLKAQINELTATLADAERASVIRAQKEYEAALNNQAMLRKSLETQEQSAFGKGEQAAKYQFMLSDYQARRMLYDGLEERLQEAGIIAGLHSTAIHVVDDADIPATPSHPQVNVNLAIGFGAGLLLGLTLALLLEMLDTSLRTMSDIEQGLQISLLAAIPSVETSYLQPAKFREMATSTGATAWSSVAEALRSVRTTILLSSPGFHPKIIMIASPRPSEGKSTVASLMAITFVLNGARVLLIDADMRRPSVHIRFGTNNNKGLSSFLSGSCTLQEAIVEWPEMPDLHIMGSGPVPPLPSELLGSKQMQDLLDKLRGEYDFIFIDTPPTMAFTDASILGGLSDAVILVFRYGAVQKHVAQRSIDLLERSNSRVLGVVVNAVDFKAPEYSDYYGRKYYQYYGERSAE